MTANRLCPLSCFLKWLLMGGFNALKTWTIKINWFVNLRCSSNAYRAILQTHCKSRHSKQKISRKKSLKPWTNNSRSYIPSSWRTMKHQKKALNSIKLSNSKKYNWFYKHMLTILSSKNKRSFLKASKMKQASMKFKSKVPLSFWSKK